MWVALAAILFLCGCAINFLTTPYQVNVFDEGLILTGALRVLAGEMPSADFYTNYGPAQFYLVAGFFDLFGRNLTVARAYDALIAAAILPAAAGVLGNQALRWYGLASLGFIFVLVLLYRSPLYPITPCILLILIGIGLTVSALEDRAGALVYLWIGLVIAALTCFRYDFMLIGAAAFGTPILLLLVFQVWSGAAALSASFSRGVEAAVLAGLPAALLLAVLYAVGILQPALRDLLTYNAANYVEMRNLPFPDLSAIRARPAEALAIYLPPMAGILGISTCCILGRTAIDRSSRQFRQILILTCVTLAFFSKGLVRTSGEHMLIADVPAALLVFFCLAGFESRFGPLIGRKAVTGVRVFCIVMTVAAIAYGLDDLARRDTLYRFIHVAPAHPDLPPMGLYASDRERIEAARYVMSITGPNERLLSATGRHDKVFVNDVFFYFLTQRLPGTRWQQYDPGVQTSEEVQKQMAQDLEDNKVSVVVRDFRWDRIREPNKSAESSGVTLLDDYIAQHYREDRRFGPISVLRRVD